MLSSHVLLFVIHGTLYLAYAMECIVCTTYSPEDQSESFNECESFHRCHPAMASASGAAANH
jgi:hypothetical protein